MKKHTGFTFIELMVTLVIFAIVVSVAIPKMSDMFGQKTLSPIGGIFNKALQLTRIEAIQRGRPVYLEPAMANDWTSGWAIRFEDDQSPPVVQTIRVFDAPPSNSQIISTDFDSSTPILILPSGQASRTGSFTIKLDHCLGGEKLLYELLISGMFNKQVLPCT